MLFCTRILSILLQWTVIVTAKPRPHVILFVVDDLGWNDVGLHGMTEIPTPNIDALAYNGIIINNYYTYPLCTPSRSALLSGKLPTSTGLQRGVILNGQPLGMPLDVNILPQFLDDLGYESHIVGKWHLGSHMRNYTPSLRGFKTHYGYWSAGINYFTHDSPQEYAQGFISNLPVNYVNQTVFLNGKDFRDGFAVVNHDGQYLTYLLKDRAVDIIQKHNQSNPLFLYMAHQGVHRGDFYNPLRGPDDLTKLFIEENSTRQNFAGALTAVDKSLGDLMEVLEKKNMLQDTLIIFSSDNGAPLPPYEFGYNGGSNYPLTGGKGSVWEGGLRGTSFIWKSDLKTTGFVYNGLMHIVDWLPTIYTAVGGTKNIVEQFKLDGMNLWQAVTENKTSPRTHVLLQADGNLTAFRSGDYKIISGEAVPIDFQAIPGRGPPPSGLPTKSSKTEQVLKRVFGSNTPVKERPIEVDCGARSNEKCDPSDAPCLFNVKDDPCEIRNLAKTMPEILSRLQEEMKGIPTIKANFPKVDYTANPDFYCGYWTTWLDDPHCPNMTTVCTHVIL